MAATSENVLADSDIAATKQSVTTTTTSLAKPQLKAEQWEIDGIGKLLVQLYNAKKISLRGDWSITKQQMRQEYQRFTNETPSNLAFVMKLNEKYGSLNIGTLLHRTGFLIDTPRGCNFYRIRYTALFQYRNNLLKRYDESCKNGEFVHFTDENVPSENESALLQMDQILQPTHEIAENAAKHDVVYKARKIQIKDHVFVLSSMGCCMCQINFETTEEYEDHVEYHSEESDFKSLEHMNKSDHQTFKLFYQVCKDSHFFGFTIEILDNHDKKNEFDYSNKKIIIDKIIIVQSRLMFYVNNSRVPYEMPSDGKEVFYVDSHLFTKYVEQPIVIVFHYKANENVRFFEQYHFMCVEDLPCYSFAISPRRLPKKKVFTPKFKLPQYLPAIRKATKNSELLAYILGQSNEFCDYYNNGKKLTLHNYCETMQMLLQVEDLGILAKYFNLIERKVILRNFENQYSLKLSKNGSKSADPILAIYDEVIVIADESEIANKITKSSHEVQCEILLRNNDDILRKSKNDKSTKKKIFSGIVDFVSNERVTFVCDDKIPIDCKYTIIFRPNRLNIRYQYRALELLAKMPARDVKRFLFPEFVTPIYKTLESWKTSDIIIINKNIYDNPEQLQAVRFIAEGPRSDAPYIIHGPPGTGKTTTLTEAIIQLYLRRPHTKILVTSGSNSACDELALRLCKLLEPLDETQAIVRIYSRANEQRSENIDDLLLEHSNMYAGQFYPDVEVIHEYRIVVCTLSVVGKLATGKFGKTEKGSGIFSHVFVDEVAATTEAETLMALMCILTESTSLIIAGDNKQLGPIIKSELAQELGLGVSLIDRLIERNCYSLDEHRKYDPTIQTRLIRNHRSHPEIVKLYSDLFYDGQLIAMCSNYEHNICEKWCGSPSNEFPIIFHSVFGRFDRDGSSTSLSNPQELEVVMDYVKDLMYFGIAGEKIYENDIGIISPYKKQYLQIQQELNLRNWYGIQTGSVEIFQGQEKKIIIVSFVRSFSTSLGFLENMRRLNVTLSRAKSLMILIGNPKTLSQNETFKSIIHLCNEKNTLIGSTYFELYGELPNKSSSANSRKDKNDINKKNKLNGEKHQSKNRIVRKTNEQLNKSSNQQNLDLSKVQENDLSEKTAASRRRRHYKKNNNNRIHPNNSNNKNNNNNDNNNINGEDIYTREHQTQRRQSMKKRIPPQHNFAHKHHNINTKTFKNLVDPGEISASTSSSSSSSVASSALNDATNIDTFFQSLPSLNDHKLSVPKTTKVINEDDLINRARKLNINTPYKPNPIDLTKNQCDFPKTTQTDQHKQNGSLTLPTTTSDSTIRNPISTFANCKLSNLTTTNTSPDIIISPKTITMPTASNATAYVRESATNSNSATTFTTSLSETRMPIVQQRQPINQNQIDNLRPSNLQSQTSTCPDTIRSPQIIFSNATAYVRESATNSILQERLPIHQNRYTSNLPSQASIPIRLLPTNENIQRTAQRVAPIPQQKKKESNCIIA